MFSGEQSCSVIIFALFFHYYNKNEQKMFAINNIQMLYSEPKRPCYYKVAHHTAFYFAGYPTT